MKSAAIAAILAATLAASAARMAYVLPDATDSLLRSAVKEVFSCDGRPFGYYADVANDCKLFHVCQPIVDEAGEEVEMAHFSFLCGNQTVFNQEALTCTFAEDAFPCDQAESLYSVTNAEWFRVPEAEA